MDMQIILNTETEFFEYPPYDIVCVHQEEKRKTTWARRIIHALKEVKTQYVLLFLEDFWLKERVDDLFFRRTIQWMDDNPDVANFSFYPCLPGENIQDDRFDRFERRPQKCRYKFNCQVGLWRTSELIGFFREHESPWDWELFGSIRAGRCKKAFYTLKENASLVFNYGDNLKGCIVCRGKWVKDEVIPLAEKYGLSIDYSLRGFYDFSQNKKQKNRTLGEWLAEGQYFSRGIRFIKEKYRKWLSVRIRMNEKKKELAE